MTSPARVPWYLSIGTRLLATTALLIVVIVGAVLWQWAKSARELVRDQAKQEGQAVAQTLALALTPFIADENWNQARIVSELLLQRDADFVYLIVTDERSPMIALSFPADQEQRFVTDLVPASVSRRAMEQGEPRFAETVLLHDVASAGRVALRGEAIIEVAQDIRFTTARFGVVRIGISLRRAEKTIADTLRSALIGVGGCLVVAMFAAYFMSRRITRPVIELAELMDRVGEGDIDQEATVKGNHEIAHLGRAFNQMLAGLRQKRVLEKYVPMGARRDIADDSLGRLKLGGSRRRAAILFSDLRGFTSMSERLSPQEVVALLNEYLEIMTVCIAAHGGDINEYVGDAILAVFRCDDDQKGALAAVRAAWDMQAGLRELKKKTLNEEIKKLSMGIGVHVGDIIEGNIGSRERVKYGVVGDVVNLAARIQDRSRDGTLTFIFISDAAREDVGDAFRAVSLGEMTFKGKSKPVVVWEVAEPAQPSA
jgi:class 3 adenylate cyclase